MCCTGCEAVAQSIVDDAAALNAAERNGSVGVVVGATLTDPPNDFYHGAWLGEGAAARLVAGITQTQHPAFFGWFPSNASLSSLLGDIASGGLAALGMAVGLV